VKRVVSKDEDICLIDMFIMNNDNSSIAFDSNSSNYQNDQRIVLE